MFHLIRWNTKTDEFEKGSWFHGKLYPLRSDISFDGRWMVYLAMSSGNKTWNGVCELPWLKTVVEFETLGTWFGGGLWISDRRLAINVDRCKGEICELPEIRRIDDQQLPFTIEPLTAPGFSEDEGVLFPRLERDGWRRFPAKLPTGKNPKALWETYAGKEIEWIQQPTPEFQALHMKFAEYRQSRGRIFRFWLRDLPDLLGSDVMWAGWDSIGQLVVSRPGVVERYTRMSLMKNEPAFVHDFTDLKPPVPGRT